MKTTMKLFTYGLMIFTLVFTSCTKDGEFGPIDPAGTQGTAGIDGADGVGAIVFAIEMTTSRFTSPVPTCALVRGTVTRWTTGNPDNIQNGDILYNDSLGTVIYNGGIGNDYYKFISSGHSATVNQYGIIANKTACP